MFHENVFPFKTQTVIDHTSYPLPVLEITEPENQMSPQLDLPVNEVSPTINTDPPQSSSSIPLAIRKSTRVMKRATWLS